MLARIFSPVVYCRTSQTLAATLAMFLGQGAFASLGFAQNGYYTDDAGTVYQKVTQTIDRPVVETQIEKRNQTVYRPQTVTETTPRTRTIYTPILEYNWEPRVHGRWNPFQRATVVYHHVPRTRWEAKNEVVQRTSTRTEWIAEHRTIDIPKQVVRMQREEKVDYRIVGRVAPNSTTSTTASIASRLRPIDPGTRFTPTSSAPRIAAQPQRSTSQGGIPATTLSPQMGVQGAPAPATLPAPPIFR